MDYNIIEHFNRWWWGCTFTLITGDGLGIVELQVDDNYPSIAFVKGLSVIDSERRKGLGKELMEHCELIALREQKKFLQLSVNKEQDWLVEWYQRLGFVTIMTDEHEFTMLNILKEGGSNED